MKFTKNTLKVTIEARRWHKQVALQALSLTWTNSTHYTHTFTFEFEHLLLSSNIYFWVRTFTFEFEHLLLSSNIYFWVQTFTFEFEQLLLSSNIYFWVRTNSVWLQDLFRRESGTVYIQYLFIVNNKNNTILSKDIFLVSLLLTLNMCFPKTFFLQNIFFLFVMAL